MGLKVQAGSLGQLDQGQKQVDFEVERAASWSPWKNKGPGASHCFAGEVLCYKDSQPTSRVWVGFLAEAAAGRKVEDGSASTLHKGWSSWSSLCGQAFLRLPAFSLGPLLWNGFLHPPSLRFPSSAITPSSVNTSTKHLGFVFIFFLEFWNFEQVKILEVLKWIRKYEAEILCYVKQVYITHSVHTRAVLSFFLSLATFYEV